MTEKYARWVPNEAAEPQFGGEGVTRRVLAYTDGLMCVENTFEKGAVGSLHSHPHTQITYVVEGVFSFTIDGETRTVRKGDTMLKENGVIHGCTCLEKGILLDIFINIVHNEVEFILLHKKHTPFCKMIITDRIWFCIDISQGKNVKFILQHYLLCGWTTRVRDVIPSPCDKTYLASILLPSLLPSL